MINVQIDLSKIDKLGLSINEFFTLVKLKYPLISFSYTPLVFRDVTNKGLVDVSRGRPVLTKEGDKLISPFILDLEAITATLAEELRSIYPQGKKSGIYYWRGSSKEIEQKLKVFFKKYGHYDPEKIIGATKKYVESFDSSDIDKAMMLLKYFIEKEGSSTLQSYLENLDKESVEIEYGRNIIEL